MIPSLPTEILHHTIKLSLPVVSFDTYRQRYDLLLVYSLVDSTWRALAQNELHKGIFLEDHKAPKAFGSQQLELRAPASLHLVGSKECHPDYTELIKEGTAELRSVLVGVDQERALS